MSQGYTMVYVTLWRNMPLNIWVPGSLVEVTGYLFKRKDYIEINRQFLSGLAVPEAANTSWRKLNDI